ncbi:MAG: condensation domain-containing protein [Chlamydiales bacterium]
MKRSLGFFESMYTYCNEIAPAHANIGVVISIQGFLDLDLLRESLYFLFQRHHNLRCSIQKEANGYSFIDGVEIDTIPLRVVKKSSSEQWKVSFEEEIHRPFPTDRYLWKLLVLEDIDTNQHEIIASFHHAIMDGISGYQFFDDLLNYYSLLFHKTKPQFTHLPLLRSIEQSVGFDYPEEKYFTNMGKYPASLWPYHEHVPVSLRKTKFLFRVMDEHLFTSIANAAKKHRISINSILHAALALSLARFHQKSLELQYHTPMQLRGHSKPPIGKEYLGCFISVLVIPCSNLHPRAPFWTLASEYEKQIRSLIPTAGFSPIIFSLSNVAHQLNQSINFCETHKSFPMRTGITNLGVLSSNVDYHPLTLRSFFFGSVHTIGRYPLFVYASSINKTMFVSLEYISPLLDLHSVSPVWEMFFTILEESAHE